MTDIWLDDSTPPDELSAATPSGIALLHAPRPWVVTGAGPDPAARFPTLDRAGVGGAAAATPPPAVPPPAVPPPAVPPRSRARPVLVRQRAVLGPALPTRAHALRLARLLALRDHWRLFPELARGARYIDIETTGLSPRDAITLVGISDGRRTRTLVRGVDLTRERLARALGGARLLVSFNGLRFDVPRLRRHFPGLPWDLPHFDLAVCGRRVGLSGGLKRIEQRLGAPREAAVDGLGGAEAAGLWRAHEAGDPRAVPLLARYCRADVGSLVELAPRIHRRLVERLGASEPGWLQRDLLAHALAA